MTPREVERRTNLELRYPNTDAARGVFLGVAVGMHSYRTLSVPWGKRLRCRQARQLPPVSRSAEVPFLFSHRPSVTFVASPFLRNPSPMERKLSCCRSSFPFPNPNETMQQMIRPSKHQTRRGRKGQAHNGSSEQSQTHCCPILPTPRLPRPRSPRSLSPEVLHIFASSFGHKPQVCCCTL